MIVFAVNKSLDNDIDVDLQGYESVALTKHIELYCDNLKAVNSADTEAVSPEEKKISDMIVLRKHSWNMLVFKY